MKLLDLAPEILAEIIQETVLAVDVGQAFRLRLVCSKTCVAELRPLAEQLTESFEAQALRAIFTTRVIRDCQNYHICRLGGEVIVPKYLESRSLAGSEDGNQLLAAIRCTAKSLVVSDGVDSQHTWNNNISALCQAATTHLSYKEVLRLLHPKKDGIDPWIPYKPPSSNTKIEDEVDAFVGAAYIGNVVKVHEALLSCSDVQRGSRFFGYPLQCACAEGHKDIVIMLLEHGVKGLRDVPSRRYGSIGFGTPLQSACSGGREDIVRLVLDPKYKLSVSDFEYYDSALRAARGGHLDIVMLLLQKGAPRTIAKQPLLDVVQEASRHGQEDFVRNFVNHKPFTVEHFGVALRFALAAAAAYGHFDLVQLLLAQDAKGEYGNLWSPFFHASRQGFERVVRLLLEHGVDTTEWPSIISPAATAGQAHIVSFLLENQATLSPNGYGSDGVLALERALKGGHQAVVHLLNDHGISSAMVEH